MKAPTSELLWGAVKLIFSRHPIVFSFSFGCRDCCDILQAGLRMRRHTTVLRQFPYAVNHMSIRESFIAAVRKCSDLPEGVRVAAATVQDLEERCFDSTYLDFLDKQIELNARGDEWSDRLGRRRSGLANWCDHPLLRGRIVVGPDDYTIEVDRITQTVVYWEKFAGWHTDDQS